MSVWEPPEYTTEKHGGWIQNKTNAVTCANDGNTWRRMVFKWYLRLCFLPALRVMKRPWKHSSRASFASQPTRGHRAVGNRKFLVFLFAFKALCSHLPAWERILTLFYNLCIYRTRFVRLFYMSSGCRSYNNIEYIVFRHSFVLTRVDNIRLYVHSSTLKRVCVYTVYISAVYR